MSLDRGRRLGPYEIQGPLGAGGMGEVYRARDTRLDRTIALKILPAHLAADPERRERFDREARAISHLSHPNICTLHDIGADHGVDFLVMECLEGETLAEHLKRGPLPVAPALQIAMQIGAALEAAHAAGIVHRDLKPSNVFLVRGASASAPPLVKLLDFGLAKAMSSIIAPATASPTIAQALTGQGTILGTLQYMAPEQLEGREADARADVFAFGCLLFEMLTGQPAFAGKSQASIIASILSADPPAVTSRQPLAPAALDHLVARALAKDPDERWSAIHDVLLQLKWIAALPQSSPLPGGAPAAVGTRERRWWMAAVATLIAALGATAAWLSRREPVVPARVHFEIGPPEGTTFLAAGFGTIYMTPVLSNDGASIVIPAIGTDGIRRLWLRRLDASEPQLLPGTDNGFLPFWAPDDRSLAFFADGRLLRLDLPGGPPRLLAEAPSGSGGAWSQDGVVVFAPTADGPLYRLPANGGVPAAVTTLDAASGDASHRFPDFLPDGRHFLFLARRADFDKSEILVGSLDSRETTAVMQSALRAVFVPPRAIAYQGAAVGGAGTLLAPLFVQTFDPATRRTADEPIALQQNVVVAEGGQGGYSFSDQGTFSFRVPSAVRTDTLNWYTRDGTLQSSIGEPGDYTVPRLSPDGRKLAVASRGSIWIRDLARGTVSRLTGGPAHCCPVWSPDGARIAFRNGALDLAVIPASGTEPVAVVLANGIANTPTAWTPDGSRLLYQALGKNRLDTMVLTLAEPRAPKPLQHSPFNEEQASLSPDGRWIAFTSDESGRPQVYVQDYPGLKEKWMVSTTGGADPQWRADGAELFYLGVDHKLMAVPIARGPSFDPGVPIALFQTRVTGLTDVRTHYQVAADGQRFLVNSASPGDRGAPIHVVVNWAAGLTR